MNLPNKLTVTRLILAPVFFVWYFIIELVGGLNPIIYSAVLVVIYGVMELTDLLDGKIARKYHLVTDLGKVMDPFGDVIIHLTFFTCFLYSGIAPVWAFIIILWREFSQSFMRMLLMGKGKPMAANIFGKAKTCLYAFCSIYGIFYRIMMVLGKTTGWMATASMVLFGLAACASAVSFLIYIKNVFRQGTLKDMTR
ncbi:MAG: CDP-diacylglycerol--glycerol-3-phosphate 3-phosphatidyltransferase [Sphaerochaetaceae bacterium]|nr:CDP-diacylglycerol--glycerol-3-phosphate 3-phosphatidyltransferase [Sphaerochaetaceae bacterium]